MSTSPSSGSSGPRPGLNEDAAPDRRSADVGIVCSHRGELRPFLKRLDRQRKYRDGRLLIRGGFLGETIRVAVVEAGARFADHRAAAELLIREHQPRWILITGFSSALTPDVQPGDLCLASEVADTHGQLFPVRCTIPARKRIHVGRLLTADERPADVASRTALTAAHPGLAVDTVSLAPVPVCLDHQVRCLVLRAVVDGSDEEIPASAQRLLFQPDSLAMGTALGSLVRNVRNFSELASWRARASTAAVNLDRFLTGLVEQIAGSATR